MATRTREDRRLRLLSAVCLGLPEAERTNCGAHADFRVRGKVFAYFSEIMAATASPPPASNRASVNMSNR